MCVDLARRAGRFTTEDSGPRSRGAEGGARLDTRAEHCGRTEQRAEIIRDWPERRLGVSGEPDHGGKWMTAADQREPASVRDGR